MYQIKSNILFLDDELENLTVLLPTNQAIEVSVLRAATIVLISPENKIFRRPAMFFIQHDKFTI